MEEGDFSQYPCCYVSETIQTEGTHENIAYDEVTTGEVQTSQKRSEPCMSSAYDAAPLLNKQYNNAGEAINLADSDDGGMKVKIKADAADDTLGDGTAFAPANGNAAMAIKEKAVASDGQANP